MKRFPLLLCIHIERVWNERNYRETSGCAPAILVRADPHAHRESIVYGSMASGGG